MTPAKFASYIRLKTNTNSTTLPDATILVYANIIKDDIAKEITKANEDYFGIKLLRNLVAGQRNYKFPSYILNQMKMLQVKLDGINMKRLREFDVNSYRGTTDESAILAYWAGKEPQFDIFGGEIVIYNDSAIIDVTNGIELWSMIYPENLTSLSSDTTDMEIPSNNENFGIPRQFHMVWATKVIIQYKTSKEKPIPLNEQELNVDKDMQLALNALKGQNLDRTVTATIPYDDGSNY